MEQQEKHKTKKQTSNYGIQDYLSIGYMFLLMLGILHETIYYKFLDINILEYSSVLDVLISPVSVFTGNLSLLIGLFICIVFSVIYVKLMPRYYKWLGKKKKYQSEEKKEKLAKINEAFSSNGMIIFLISLFVIGLFIGFGLGGGKRTKEKISKEKISITHQLIFEDGEKKDIKMLGKNSLYVFYVTQTDREVAISPIDGNIKTIKKLKEKE